MHALCSVVIVVIRTDAPFTDLDYLRRQAADRAGWSGHLGAIPHNNDIPAAQRSRTSNAVRASTRNQPNPQPHACTATYRTATCRIDPNTESTLRPPKPSLYQQRDAHEAFFRPGANPRPRPCQTVKAKKEKKRSRYP